MQKHNKIKNVGLVWELLTRQLTQDVLSNKPSKAMKILREHFTPDSELFKELECINVLTKTKYDNPAKAELLVSEVVKQRKKLNHKKLNEEKYNLIKVIKENYDIDNFFSFRVSNYKVLASIYQLFEAAKLSPADVVAAKFTIIENVCQKNIAKDVVVDAIQEEYSQLDKTTKSLVFKLLVKSFNERYENLSKEQKSLLSEYITNISNSPALTEAINIRIPKLKISLEKLGKSVTDDVVKIKLTEVCGRLDTMLKGGRVTDEHVLSLLRYYALKEELRQSIKGTI